jgi:hypothetical protein
METINEPTTHNAFRRTTYIEECLNCGRQRKLSGKINHEDKVAKDASISGYWAYTPVTKCKKHKWTETK